MYGIIINSKECAAEDEPGYFISLSQQKEKGIHMNTFLQSVQNLDGEILLQIQQHLRTDMLTPLMKFVTFLGNGGWFWIVLCILMVVLAKIPGEKYSIKDENCSRAVIGRAGWYGLLSMGAGALITNVCLKNLVARTRPYEVVEGLVPLIGKPTDYSFPSGHTCAAATLITLTSLPMFFKEANTKKYEIICWCSVVAFVLIVMVTRLIMGKHFLSDVLIGGFVTVICYYVCLIFGKKLYDKKIKLQPLEKIKPVISEERI